MINLMFKVIVEDVANREQCKTCFFQQTSFLYNVRHSLHLNTLGLVDIFEGIQFPGLFVLHNPDLQ
jgi:hypothetical protein